MSAATDMPDQGSTVLFHGDPLGGGPTRMRGAPATERWCPELPIVRQRHLQFFTIHYWYPWPWTREADE